MTWDTASPAGSDLIRDGDNEIREFKTDIQTALRANAADGTEAKFPGSDTANPIYRYRGLRGTTGSKPSSGQYGLYFNTTTNQVERDNGTTWDVVGTLIPTGTVMVFYQAAAPTGWTIGAVVNDRILRVVTGGSGGSTGGSWSAISISGTTSSNGSHDHTVDSHTHGAGSFAAELDFDGDEIMVDLVNPDANWSSDQRIGSVSDQGSSGGTRSSAIDVQGTSGGASPDTDSAGAHTHTFSDTGTHGSAQHAYADVIIATKD